MSLQVTIVVGNPKPRSRTRTVAEALVQALVPTAEPVVIDLAEHADGIFAWESPALSALTTRVAESDLVVIASPTYKATYTGLLKAFLDRYAAGGLGGVVAIPLLTGGDRTHAMGPTFTLAPLLAELGAIVPGRGLYFEVSQLDRLDEVIGAAAAEYRANLAALARVSAATAEG